MSFDEEMPGGLGREEALAIAHRVVAEGIDFISIIRGYMGSDEALSRVIPPMGTPVAPHLEFAGEIKRQVGVPVMHASRINDVATARHAIRRRACSILVGMTRAAHRRPRISSRKSKREKRTGSDRAWAPAFAWTRSTRPATPSASTTLRQGP
jgi:2,4-dienoyl-CoA reductase-like NADH-dependent reductase (Old Yellow Enzyme family)